MRIVSLLGSATEIVFELGLEESLVGISHECDYPPAALDRPRVSRPRFDPTGLTSGEIDAAVRRCMEEFGSVYEVDRTLLAELRPDLVLTQGLCEVCAVPTGSVEEAVASLPRPVEIVALDTHTIGEIFQSILRVAAAAAADKLGELTTHRLRNRVAAVVELAATLRPPSVLLLEWLDPPFAPGHWVPEMIEIAGGRNLLGAPGVRSRELRWDELDGLLPEVLLVEPCGFDLEQATADADRHRDRLARIAPDAMANRRAWVLHSAWFSRSGPRIVEGIELLAHVLHPGHFPGSAVASRGRLWP